MITINLAKIGQFAVDKGIKITGGGTIVGKNITWNSEFIKKMLEYSQSEEARTLVQETSQQILNATIPQLPVNLNRKKKLKGFKPLQQAMKAYAPKLYTIYEYRKSASSPKKKVSTGVKGWRVLIKPQRRTDYYFVVMSGKNTYNGKKREIKYQSPTAIPLALSKKLKTFEEQVLYPKFNRAIWDVINKYAK